MNAKVFDAIVIGGLSGGLTLSNVAILRPDAVVGSVFDDTSHTWTLQTRSGDNYDASVVVAYGDAPQRDGTVPYLGVAVHGLPNHFFIAGADIRGQQQYIADCLNVMAHTGSTRIEVRHSTQRTYTERYKPGHTINWRHMRKKIRSAFDLSSHTGVEDEVYDGPATARIGDGELDVRVRLTGHMEPIDGRYHWQGTVFDAPPDAKLPQAVALTVGGRTAEARLVERTPWGGYSVAGVGAPPFALDDVELAVPVL